MGEEENGWFLATEWRNICRNREPLSKQCAGAQIIINVNCDYRRSDEETKRLARPAGPHDLLMATGNKE
jgi:hypothetical protein